MLKIITSVCALFCFFSCQKKELDLGSWREKFDIQFVKMEGELFSKKIRQGFTHSLNRCFLSDADMILIDQNIDSNKHMVVSIERIDKKEPPLFQSTFNPKDYKPKITESSFLNPFANYDGVYGVFVCSTKKLGDNCHAKDFYDYLELTPYLISKSSDKKKVKSDKIFYFQPAFIHGDTLFFVKEFKDYNNLNNMIQDVFQYDNKLSTNLSKRIKRWNDVLRNFPLQEDNMLLVDLAKMAPECDKKAHIKHYRDQKGLKIQKHP